MQLLPRFRPLWTFRIALVRNLERRFRQETYSRELIFVDLANILSRLMEVHQLVMLGSLLTFQSGKFRYKPLWIRMWSMDLATRRPFRLAFYAIQHNVLSYKLSRSILKSAVWPHLAFQWLNLTKNTSFLTLKKLINSMRMFRRPCAGILFPTIATCKV